MQDILLVDDDPNLLQGLSRTLRGFYKVQTATGGEQALRLLDESGPFAVVVSDMRMPHMDGVTLLAEICARHPQTVRIMLTGNSDQDTAIKAVNQGAIFRFLNKPCTKEDLLPVLAAAVRQHQLIIAEKQLLEDTLTGAIHVLTQTLSMADARLFGQATRMRDLARSLANLIPPADRWAVDSAAMLASIGLIAIPPVVVTRSRQGQTLTNAERAMLARIPDIGYELLNHIPRLQLVADIVRYQNKNYDGSGHPVDSTAGKSLPLGARLLRILRDVIEPLSEGTSAHGIFASMRQKPGAYDPELLEQVAAVLGVDQGVESIVAEMTDEVRLLNLRIDQVLAANIVTQEGSVLVTAGQRVTSTIQERLRNFASTVGIREPILIRREAAAAVRARD